MTQPRFSFWFERFGWGVENYGVDPDIEVVTAPQDRAADRDVQLDYAITLVQQLLEEDARQAATGDAATLTLAACGGVRPIECWQRPVGGPR